MQAQTEWQAGRQADGQTNGRTSNNTHQPGLEVLGPSLHDSSVVHTVHNDCMNSRLPESVLVLQIVRDLPCGSRGREGTRQTHKDHRLVLTKVGKVVLLGRESLVQVNAGKHISDRCEGTGGGIHQAGSGCRETAALREEEA